jgi:hypothetical protein
MAGFKDLIEPMTLGNMGADGVRFARPVMLELPSPAIVSADPWPDHVPVPTVGLRVVCTRCGIIGVDAPPNVGLMQCNTPLPRWANKRHRGSLSALFRPSWPYRGGEPVSSCIMEGVHHPRADGGAAEV